MRGNSTGGGFRRLSRALACTAVIAGLAASETAAQPVPLAYRADYPYLCFEDEHQMDFIETDSYLVTPGTTLQFADEPTWSPDGTRIAIVNRGTVVSPLAVYSCVQTGVGTGGLFVISPFGGSGLNLTGTAPAADPAWSPDGAQIAFARSAGTPSQIYVINPDGSGLLRVTPTVVLQAAHPTWSPDSARMAFECEIEAGNWDICVMKRDGSGLVRLTSNAEDDLSPVWSPDGSKIVFATARFGPVDVLALMNPDGSDVSRIGAGIQGWPRSWSPDGAQIAFTWYGAAQELCSIATGNCYLYTPFAIYTTTPDGVNVGLLVDPGANPAWMPPRPIAQFHSTCNGLTCTVDASASFEPYGGTLTSYGWNFGDGIGGAGTTTVHTFPRAGNYQVRLTVTDSNGVTGTTVQTVSVPPLVASFTSACSQRTCTFDASGSLGLIASYSWSFGDGTSGAGATTSHTFGLGGNYLVTLTATDINGVTGTAGQWVSVLVASFTATCNLAICTFNGSSSQGVISSYGWTFGDGTNASGPFVAHAYVIGGTYTVTLTVVSGTGGTAQTSQTVAPNSPPTASFTVTCDRLTCTFNASSSRDLDGSIVSYGWNFGDGTTGAGITTTHGYRSPGTYTVRLIATDNRGATGAQDQSVTVSRQPRRP